MLPIILQHVRELTELHTAPAERDRYKIITPFPPSGPEFPDFAEDAMMFGDPPADGDSASLDTLRAFEFFNRTDNLYYDFSYGIRSDDYLLSQICQKFFMNAQTDTSDLNFNTSFSDRRNAFLHKYLRSTAGDLGRYEFRYTSSSPISWNAERVVINTSNVERLKAKAIEIYGDLEVETPGPVEALIEEVRSSNYSAIEYEFGFFDVIREWLDPRLFESSGWMFSSGSRTLYGETDPYFVNNDVKLCFAQRFYLIKNYTATPIVAPQPSPPVVVHHHGNVGVLINQQRREMRNQLIGRKLTIMASAPTPAAVFRRVPTAVPQPRPGYVWVPTAGRVPGHWERERARPRPEPSIPTVKPTYKIAAVKCRVLPAKP